MKYNVIVKNGYGRLGNNVFYARRGVQMARIWQPVVSNPKTAKQTLTRAKFTILTQMAQKFGNIIQIGFKDALTSAQTSRNLFVKYNYKLVSGTNPADFEVAYDEIRISKGSLPVLTFGTVNYQTPQSVIIPISDGNINDVGASGDDRLAFAIYCPELNKVVTTIGSHSRSDANVTIAVPNLWSGMKVHVYAFAISASDANKVSNTIYVGSGTLA